MLLGTDLEKSTAQLIAAYDDSLGVTAAFNLNILARINRELGADFDLKRFEHVARINREARRVEMHLRSRGRQTVSVPEAELLVEFQDGETIWTESSHKYSVEEVFEIAQAAGFVCEWQWIDEEWPFAESLLVAQ
jgi:L-histidine Nalpha-methyltransferase